MAYRSSQSASSNIGVSSIDVTAPSGVATGDAVVCSSTVDANSTATTLPTGATALASSPQTSTFDAQRHACGVKYESGTPPATYTFSFDASIECCAVVAAYSGVDSTPLHTSSGNASSSGSGSPRAVDASSITTTVSCDLVWVGSADWAASGNSPAYTPPTGYSERQDLYNGSFCSLSLADKEGQAATTTGTVSGTATATSGSAGFTAFLVALKLSAATAQKITELGALTSPALEDLLAIADDPTGTLASKKGTLSAIFDTFLSSVVVQTKTVGSGTYTPTTGMKKVLAIAVGAGGGGRSATATDEAGGGGGAGGTVIRLMTATDIGASKSYVVGAGGSANNAGAATTLDTAGALMNAGGGGTGSVTGASTTLGVQAAGGAGGTAANGDLNVPGQPGGRGLIFDTTNGLGGYGGRSAFGGGGSPGGSNTAGSAGTAYGSGGAGGHASGATDKAGGAGANGILYLIEFLEI